MKKSFIFYLLTAMITAACSSDDPAVTVGPELLPDSYYLGFEIRNMPVNSSRGSLNPDPGGTVWGDGYTYDGHTAFEQYIRPDQLWVAVYAFKSSDATAGAGKIIGLCKPVGLKADGTPITTPYEQPDGFIGVLEIFDSSNIDQWDAARVVVYANAPYTRGHFIDDNADKANPADAFALGPDYNTRGNSIRDLVTATANGQPHVDGKPDAPYVCESIPAWGMTTVNLSELRKGKTLDIGTIDMLPAVAKHRVRFAPGLHGNPRIISAQMSYMEKACRITPAKVFANDDATRPYRSTKEMPIHCLWNTPALGYDSPTFSNLMDDGSIMWYTADIANSNDGVSESGYGGSQVKIFLTYEESGSVRTATIYYRNYVNGNYVPGSGNDKLWDIVRNNYYDFEITGVGTDFKVRATVAPWRDGGSFELKGS